VLCRDQRSALDGAPAEAVDPEGKDLALKIDNLQVLCADCNCGKGNCDSTDWR
jgi:hypothetical protein